MFLLSLPRLSKTLPRPTLPHEAQRTPTAKFPFGKTASKQGNTCPNFPPMPPHLSTTPSSPDPTPTVLKDPPSNIANGKSSHVQVDPITNTPSKSSPMSKNQPPTHTRHLRPKEVFQNQSSSKNASIKNNPCPNFASNPSLALTPLWSHR